MSIAVDESMIPDGAPLSDFVVLLDITSTNLTSASSKVQDSNGYDILITDGAGNPLDFELLSYTGSSGRFRAWVEVPTLDDNANTTLYVYYGNSSVSTNQSTNATWSENFIIVDHMESSGSANAVGNGLNPSSDNTTSGTGKIGGARSFSGSNQLVSYPDNALLDLTNNFTISAWVNSSNASGQPDLITKGGYQNAYSTWLDNDDLVMHTDGNDLRSATNQFGNGSWRYLTFVWDGSNGRFIYLDGSLIQSDGTTTNCTTNSSTLTYSTTSFDYQGLLDEVRIIGTVRSSAWIQTEYNNQNNPATYFSLGSEECGGNTFYTYQSGNFTNPLVWTTDPSGTTLQNSAIPGPCDEVVLLSGKTITSTANGIDVNAVTISDGSVLDLSTTSGHSFGTVSGTGTLILRNTQLPSGDYSAFGGNSGGTLQLIDPGTGNFPNGSSEWNYLEIISTNASSDAVTLASNLTVHGNLTLSASSGTLVFTLGNNTTSRSLIVEGDLTIGSGTSMNTGSFNAIHQVQLHGNMTVDGSVDFANDAQYSSASNGAAELTFTGLSNNSLTGSGAQLDLYRLILNKGSDPTYRLNVDHSALSLWGPVDPSNGSSAYPFSEENPEINKALWIRSGTLRLMEGVNIPVLTEGGNDFFIPLAAELWIDGATVASTSANGASGNTGLTVIGTFRISAGTYSGNKSAGIVYRGTSTVIIEGGTVDISQYRPSGTVIGSANTSSYTQSGGEFICRGDNETAGEIGTGNGIFDLGFYSSAFVQTGGSIIIRDASGTGSTQGFYVGVDLENASTNGGRVIMDMPGSSSAYINSTAPLNKVIIRRRSGTGDATVLAGNNLTVRDSLLVESNTVFNASGENVITEGHVVVAGTLTPGSGRWYVNGTGSRNWSLGGSVGTFEDWIVALSGSDSVTVSGAASMTINDSLNLSSGAVHLSGTRIDVESTFYNGGSVRGSSAVRFNGNTAYTWGGNGSGTIASIEVSGNTSSSSNVTLAANQTITGQLTFIPGASSYTRSLSLSTFNLNLPSSTAISGAGTNGSGFNGIIAGGLASDGGLTIQVDALSTVFPLAKSGAYLPCTLTLSQAPSSYGSVTVKGVDQEHPNVTENNQSLTYYWKISSGITLGSANAGWEFNYAAGDITGTEGNYNEARFNGLTWSKDGTGSVNTGSNIIQFTGSDYQSSIAGDYTAGNTVNADPFGAVDIYYSRQSGAWSSTSTWSLTGHTVNDPPAQEPQSNSIVVIGGQDSVYTTSNNERSGSLTIESGSSLDIGANTGHEFGIVAGEGRMRLRQSSLPGGDLEDFLGASGGTVVLYVNGSNQTYSGLDISCRNMIWRLQTNNRMSLSGTIDVLEDLITSSPASSTQDFRIEVLDLTVGGDLTLISGDFRYRNSSGISNVSVGGSFNILSNARVQVSQNTDRIHTLSIGDSLNATGGFDIYLTSTRYVELEFNGTGVSAITGNGTIDIESFTVNKGSDTTSQLWVSNTGNFTLQNSNWLTLSNGMFVYNRSDTRVIGTSASTFSIPSTAGIRMNNASGTLRVIDAADDDADLILAGALVCSAGTLQVGDPSDNTGNDIEYTTGGAPVILVTGGDLWVNGQVRRNLATTVGSVTMEMSGSSEVTIAGKNADGSRGKLEIVNSGSLVMSDNARLIFQRGGASSVADLKIVSGSSSLSEGTIVFETASGIFVAQETFTLDSEIPINNLEITGSSGDEASVQLLNNPLTINGDLNVTNAYAGFDAHELSTTIAGDLTLNGTGDWSGMTLTLNGAASDLSGSAVSGNAFYHLVLSSGKTLTTQSGADADVTGNLTLQSGAEYALGTNYIDVDGNVVLSGNITSSAASASNGLIMSGTSSQQLSGSGTIDNLIINGAGVNTQSSVTVGRQLELTSGLLFIGDYRLTLSTDAVLSGSFSATTMIATNGVLTDEGVYYNLSSGPASVLLPIGSNGKYTPASYNFSSLSASGNVHVVPVDVLHPSTTDEDQTQLDYYWFVESSGLGTYSVTHQYEYDNGDVNGLETSYVTGRFVSSNWTPVGGIANSTDAANDSITLFQVNYLDGEYTAGEADEFGSAPIFYSRSGSGFYDWDNPNSWSNDSHAGVAAATPPTGAAKIIIASGDSIATNGNLRVCQSVRNGGVLYVGTTIGHNFGRFNGTGRLVLDVAPSNAYISPAGIYTGFTSDTGGTWVYIGTVNATILSNLNQYGGLEFSGSSEKDLGSQNLTIYGKGFTILGGTVANSSDIDIEVRGSWINTAGASAYAPGTGSIAFTGTSTSVSGSTEFYEVSVNKAGANDSLSLTSGDVTFLNTFAQTNGVVSFEGGSADFRADVTNGLWYSRNTSDITLSGSGSISQALTFGEGGREINDLSITRSTASSLGSDLDVHGTLTLGSSGFQIGSNALTIRNSIAGTPGSLMSTSSSDLIVKGAGSGISVPSSVTDLRLLEVDNTNGVSLGGSVAVTDSIRAYQGEINLNSNNLTLADNGWVERRSGSISASLTYQSTANLLWANTSPINTGGELSSDRDALQTVIMNGTAPVSLASDLVVNNLLALNNSVLQLGSDSLVIRGTLSGSGELGSNGNGHLVIRNSGALTIPAFNGSSNELSTLTLDNSQTNPLGSALSVSDEIVFGSGYLELGSYDLTVAEGTAMNTASDNSFLATSGSGNVSVVLTSAGTLTVPVGDLTDDVDYTPVTIDLSSADISGSGTLTVNCTDAAATQCPGTTDYITRYWNIASSGINDPAGVVTMTYTDADVVGNEANILGKRYDGSNCINGDSALTDSNRLTIYITGFGEFTGREIDVATEPTIAASSLSFSNVEKVRFDMDWTSGDGQQRLIVAREGGPANFVPQDNFFYPYDPTFGSSPAVLPGEHIVYKGSGNSFTVDGLDPNRTYYFTVFEFNKLDTLTENYLATGHSGSQNTALEMELTVVFEGPLDSISGQMSTRLNSQNLIPLSQPFGTLYQPYNGTESVGSIPPGVSDWVMVELYKAPNEEDVIPANRVHRGAYFVLSNGRVTALDGSSNPTILPDESGELRAYIRSRNHMAFATADTLSDNLGVHTLDTRINGGISTTPSDAVSGWQVIPAGRIEYINTPYTIDIYDGVAIWMVRNSAGAYYPEDLNWDGEVDADDRSLLFNNLLKVGQLP